MWLIVGFVLLTGTALATFVTRSPRTSTLKGAAHVSRKSRSAPPPRSRAPWIITLVAASAVVLVLTVGRGGARHHVHPEPRSDTTLAYGVMPASFFAGEPRVYRVYQIAREIPATLDGIYCYCLCYETLGHRSLLQCFQSQHGAGCDICIRQAELAYQMQREGRSLEEIRGAMDLTFGRT